MTTATRTDVHRPSDLDPANYVEIGYTDAHPEEGCSWIDRSVAGDADLFVGHYTRSGACDHCGHRLRYAVHYLHEPTHEIVSVGLTCAERLGLDSREQMRFIERARAAGKAEKIDALRREYPVALGVLDEYADSDYSSEFLGSLLSQLRRKGELSPKQLRALANSAIRSAERKAEREVEAAAEPETTKLPDDLDERIEISGKVVAVKWKNNGYDDVRKLLVLDDRGFRVWGTSADAMLAPASRDEGGFIEGRDGEFYRGVERGDRVKFTARVEASEDDPAFGFYSRPTKYEYLGTPEIVAEIDADLRERAEAEIAKLDERIAAAEREALLDRLYGDALAEDQDRAAAAEIGPKSSERDLTQILSLPAIRRELPFTFAAAEAEAARRGYAVGEEATV